MKDRMRFLSAGFSILIFVLALLFASCSDIVKGDSDDDSLSSSEARVSFNITSKFGANSRTALPSIDFENFLYEIKGKNLKNGSERILGKNLGIEDLSGQKYTITRSQWIFYILAYAKNASGEAEGDSVFEGESKEIDLEKSDKTTVEMPLRASTTGYGHVRIPLKYSAEGVAKVTCGLYTSATGTDLVEGKVLQEFTLTDGITKNDNGSYSLVFEDKEVPSGKTVYARFVLYDENDVAVGYYTEAVYVAKGQLSKPEIYIRDENGKVKTDTDGNPIKSDDENASVEVEPNLFQASVKAQADKKVYAVTTIDDVEKVYELYDEDGDGIYDTVLPPGNYDILVAEKDGDIKSATKIDDGESGDGAGTSLDVSTKGGHFVAAKLNKVTLTGDEKTGATLTAKAWAVSTNADITDLVSWKWYRDNVEIEGANQSTYKITADDFGKVLKVEASQDDKGKTRTRSEKTGSVAKGKLVNNNYTVSYGDKVFTVTDGKASPKDGGLIFTKGSEDATVKSEKLSSSPLKDEIGNEITGAKVTFVNADGDEISSEKLDSSKTLTVKIEAPGYEAENITIFVTVKGSALSPEPALRTDVAELPYGVIAFAKPIPGAEYSTDGGTNWIDLTTDSFAPPASEAPASGKILVRSKAVGEKDKDGYVAPSDEKAITVVTGNIGTKIVKIKTDGVTIKGSPKVGEVLSVEVIGEDDSILTESSLISYQWYAADDVAGEGSPIEGATGKEFTPGVNEVGKFIYVTATLKNPNNDEETKTQSAPTAEKISKSKLTLPEDFKIEYDGSLEAGQVPSAEKLKVTGQLKNESGSKEIPASENGGEDGGYTLSMPDTPIESSGKVTVTIKVPGYEDKTVEIPVNVKAKTPVATEIPQFEDKTKVQEGKVQFKVTDEQTGKYEYSTDGGETWKELKSDPIAVEGESILVRTAAKGKEGTDGYVAPSEALEVPVTDKVGTFKLADFTTEYDGGVLSGDKPLASKVLLKYADGSSPDSESGFTVTFKEDKTITESSNVAVIISKEGFDPYETSVYVPVKAKAPQASEIPVLSTDKGNISGGCLKFEPTTEQAGKFEYSTDGGTTWKTLTNEEFDAPESPNKVLVRYKEKGTPGQAGYTAPSDGVEVTYSDANIGKKPVVKVEVSINPDIVITKADDDTSLTLTAADGYSSYEWKIDDKALASYSAWASADGKTLTLSKTSMQKGSYQITVVGKKNAYEYTTSITVTKE